MPILETLIQLWMVQQEDNWTLWKQKDFDSLSCEQQQSMILKEIHIFSQNVYKNNFVINTILETQSAFDIIFI